MPSTRFGAHTGAVKAGQVWDYHSQSRGATAALSESPPVVPLARLALPWSRLSSGYAVERNAKASAAGIMLPVEA